MFTFTRPVRGASAALLSVFLLSFGCDNADPTTDPLAGAQIVRCEMAKDKACIEYQRVRSGNTDAFVALDGARAVCAAGWSGDSTKPGTFAEGACSTDAALARCRITSRGYLELDYYYEGFADTATLDDPLVPLTALCKKSPGSIEASPFAD